MAGRKLVRYGRRRVEEQPDETGTRAACRSNGIVPFPLRQTACARACEDLRAMYAAIVASPIPERLATLVRPKHPQGEA